MLGPQKFQEQGRCADVGKDGSPHRDFVSSTGPHRYRPALAYQDFIDMGFQLQRSHRVLAAGPKARR